MRHDGQKKTALELGGNAPFIVFDDADLAAAAKHALGVKVSQRRTKPAFAPTDFMFKTGVHDEFVELFQEGNRPL